LNPPPPAQPRRLGRWLDKCRRQRRLAAELGLFGSLALAIRKRSGSRGAVYPLRLRQASHPLLFRAGSSDVRVFHQIFIDREYEPLCDLPNVHLVIDCGANVGYSSAYFLSRFPSSRVVAVEPDSGNYEMLERNLRSYGDRATVVHAGIWSENVPLKAAREPYRDGREWSFQVRPAEADEEPDFRGVSIPSLLEASGADRISLLKMDIEGAEAVVFGGGVEWLDKVDALAIELHDDSSFGKASVVFHEAIQDRGFDVGHSGELTICRRRGPAIRPALRMPP
jgi:FkbM family methyltransferase